MTLRFLSARIVVGALVTAMLASTANAQTDALPDTPDRSAIAAAITTVRPAINACAAGRRGQVVLALTFVSNGSLGSVRVASGSLDGAPIANTPAEACILSAAAPARVPPFRRPQLSVTYPLSLGPR
jgi:hypothetical protein